jgi:hypothetical protein
VIGNNDAKPGMATVQRQPEFYTIPVIKRKEKVEMLLN